MQRALECPVCSETFNSESHLPKTLICGHGVCEPCVRSLLAAATGSDIRCPSCRATYVIPDQQAEKLPTNFPILGLLDSLCGDCKDKPHNGRCGHCSLNVCDVCREIHQRESTTDLTDDIKDLKQSMADLNDLIADDNDFQAIQDQGEVVINKLKKYYSEQIRKLEEQLQNKIADIKAEIVCKTEELIDWKKKSRKLFVDCESLLYKQRYKKRSASTELSPDEYENKIQQDIHQQFEAIDLMKISKLKLNKICFNEFQNFTIVIRKSSNSVSQQTQTDDTIRAPLVQVPDYAAASYKAMFDKQMTNPTAICTNPTTGEIITTDFTQHEVFVLSVELQQVRKFGSEGQGSNQYKHPWGVAANDGNLYVCDTLNHMIHVTDHQGVDLTFGSQGSGQEHFSGPCGLSCDKFGLLYVCDAVNIRIKVTDKRGRFIREFGRDVFDNEPWNISVSHEGDKVAVTTYSGNNIYLFTINGQHIRTISTRTPLHNIRARGVTFDDHGHLLVADWARGRVAVMTETGDIVSYIGSPGAGPGQLDHPRGLALTQNGDFVVCDSGNKRIQIFKVPKKIM